MNLMQVRGFHLIDGESRMPNATEHLKHIRWNNTLGAFEYIEVADNHITDVDTVDTTVTITMADATEYTIELPDISNLALPGDTKILFDENGAIGGRSALTYDYTNQRVILTDSQGIYGKVTAYDGSIQNIIQYLGQNSLYLNYGNTKSTSDMADNNAIGRGALGAVTTGDDNIAIGKQAGANVSSTSSRNVFIGPYAGRIEPGNDKLYIHNADFTTLADFQEQSLFYGDFSIGRVWINNRLAVREEIKIGEFDVGNTAEGGMVRMTDAGGGLLKPQYYDNTVWVDFANGINNYVTGGSWASNILTLTRAGLGDLNITVPDTYYPSSGTQYKLQLSNGDSTFIHDNNLFWTANDVLSVDGAIRVYPNTFGDFPLEEGMLVNTGAHVYMYLDGTYKQLDNEATAGEANRGENIGGEIEVYANFDSVNKYLQFFTVRTLDSRLIITQNTGNETIDFDLDLEFTLVDAGATGVGVSKGVTGSTGTDVEFSIKKLYSSDGSVVITSYTNYLDLVATGGAGGQINDGENVGTGEGRIYDEVNGKNGLLLPYRTLKQGTNISISTDTVNKYVTISSDALLVTAANIAGGDANIWKNNTDDGSGNRTLNLRPLKGVDDVEVNLNGDVIEIGLNASLAIPDISGIIAPVATDANKTLTWSINYDADIRNSSPTTEEILQIKLGSNITYNPTTNTLDSLGGSGNPLNNVINHTIVRNVDGTVNRGSSNRNVKFILNNGDIITWDSEEDDTYGLGWLAFENDYPIATNAIKGIIQVDDTGPLSIEDGVLSATIIAPGSPDKSLQVNNSGSFGGNAGLLYDAPNDLITFRDVNASLGAKIRMGIDDTEQYIQSIYSYLRLANYENVEPVDYATTKTVQLYANRVTAGISFPEQNFFFGISDTNTVKRTYTIFAVSDNDEILKLKPGGNFYLPRIDTAVTNKILYYNISTGEVTFGPLPTTESTISTCSQVVADLGSHSSGTVDLDLDVYSGAIIQLTGGGTVTINLINVEDGDTGHIKVTHTGTETLIFSCPDGNVEISYNSYVDENTVKLTVGGGKDIFAFWYDLSTMNIAGIYDMR